MYGVVWRKMLVGGMVTRTKTPYLIGLLNGIVVTQGQHYNVGANLTNQLCTLPLIAMQVLYYCTMNLESAGLSSTESRSTVVYCVRTEFGRHYRYIANKGTGDDGMCC